MTDLYYSIKQKTEGFYKDRGSKFIAIAIPISTEQQFTEKLAAIKKQYHDARHHVYAFALGPDAQHYRASDDGEPSNSSGPPVLGQIRSFNLSDVMVVVIRYFGGTKLGVPGLINAYKTAAKDALEKAQIVEKTIEKQLDVFFAYELMNTVMRLAKEEPVTVIEQHFELDCHLRFSVRLSNYQQVLAKLQTIHQLKITELE